MSIALWIDFCSCRRPQKIKFGKGTPLHFFAFSLLAIKDITLDFSCGYAGALEFNVSFESAQTLSHINNAILVKNISAK